jgi:C-terminal processing protease CtpA/Prc
MKTPLVVLICFLTFTASGQMVLTKPNGLRYFEEKKATSIYDTLSAEAKILGLSIFWKEASYNFVFFDRLKVNWDSAYYAFLPKIIATKNVYEYWKVLDEFAKLLKDGHTGVYTPDFFWKDIGSPPVNWAKIGNRRFVTRIDERLLAEIPIGTEVVAVNGLPFEDFTAQGNSINGIKGTELTFTFRNKEGKEFKKAIARVAGKDQSIKRVPAPTATWRDFETKDLENGITYIKINTFENDSIPIKFRKEISRVNKSRALILDIRENGGGNTLYAIGVAQHLTDKSYMIGSAWKTRIHKSANKAWGSVPGDSEWTKKNFNYLIGNEWEVHEGERIDIDRTTEKITVPVIVLIGERTFSAAEDFLILLDGSKNIKLVGQPSAGSSGQPLAIDIPGGFRSRICAKRDTYPDGRDFVGIGIKPDVLVNKNVDDYLKNTDTELNEAVKILKSKGR